MGMEIVKDRCNGETIAIILYGWRPAEGVRFFTDPKEEIQVGCMRHPSGHVIRAHTHKPPPRVIERTSEVLFVVEGDLRIDFYGAELEDMSRRVLTKGDVVVILRGGHEIEILQESVIWEIKQGYHTDDKVFLPIHPFPSTT